MALTDLTDREAVLLAIREYDNIGQAAFLAKYGYGPSRDYVIEYEGRSYDSKAIIGAAFGYQFPDTGPLKADQFSGGRLTVEPALKRLGFLVTSGSGTVGTRETAVQTMLQPTLEEFIARFPQVRQSSSFGQHDELKELMKKIRLGIEALPAVQRFPHIKVSWSLGAGNWAKIPWIALMDERETDSTQRGRYLVYLFPEDMSGVYVTLNQGVTEIVDEHGRRRGRTILAEKANLMRAEVAGLTSSGFKLDSTIDLKTEGALGQDYEASTVAHKFYQKGLLPADDVIESDLAGLLDAYDRVLQQSADAVPGEASFWIFQANPTKFDIDGALEELADLTWTVKQKALNSAIGDKVFLWRSGRDAGIVATGTITAAPKEIGCPADQAKFILDHESLDGTAPRVWLHVDQRIDPPLLRSTIAAEPKLQDLMILRFAQFSTFAVSSIHARVLNEMLEEEAATAPPINTQRVWTYSPGANAEFWDEFYEQSVIAIGWDKLGDLSQFGSLDDMYEALQGHYPSERRQTNNARTCYDFVHKMQPGDLVFAKRGRNLVIGYGVVTGNYEFRSDRGKFKNIRSVRWEGRGEWPTPDTMAIKTLTDVSGFQRFVEHLKQLVSIGPIEPARPLPVISRDAFSIDDAMTELFIPREDIERALRTWRAKKNLILQGAPGVGKSFVARKLAYALMGFRDPTRVRTVQFHQSYSYEDFIQGYRPDGQRGFELKPGVFLEFCEKARIDPDESYVFIVDEINRGNLSRIFGELMLLIEPDKRSPDWATKLAYSRSGEERFYVPPNVYLLGLMNTADRSLSLVDYALRRRFGFVTLKPQFEQPAFRRVLQNAGVDGKLVTRIIDRLSELNREIAGDKTNLGTGFCIGHSFFVPTSGGITLDDRWYAEIIETEVRPLLEEYWSDDPDHADRSRAKLLAE